MSNEKITLSKELLSRVKTDGNLSATEELQKELLKNERSSIESSAKVEVARLQVAKEAIEAVKGVFEVIKSHNQFKSTVVEWQGRVAQAETEVRKAEINLQEARENNHSKIEELAQSRDSLSRVLELFDFTMEELKRLDCSKEDQAILRRELLNISDQLVKLKK
tara:strand:+ start:241 stop:732 length:492 start_codon:yes stop_codon:yes gene_type:complete